MPMDRICPTRDAKDGAAALKRVGFDTFLETDIHQVGMQSAAIRFARAADLALFYNSGHALQYERVNYLLPVDAEIGDEADLRRSPHAHPCFRAKRPGLDRRVKTPRD